MSAFIEKLSLYLHYKLQPVGWRLMKEPHPQKWVFIVGCYNSGTTLLHRVLEQHPTVGSMPNEGQFFNTVLPSGADFNLRRLWAIKPELFYLDAKSTGIDVNKLKRQWAWMYNDVRKPLLVEKTILNSARTQFLQKYFPNAYFICLFRNGYAVAEGIHRKENHAMDLCIKQWTVSNEILLRDMEHLKNKMMLRYEDFTAEPSKYLDAIAKFLEIEPFPQQVLYNEFKIHKEEGTISNRNEKSLKSLSVEDLEVIRIEGGELLKKLGYDVI